LNRRNLVLELMADQGYLPEAELAKWKAVPIPDSPTGTDASKLAPYFVELVRIELDSRYGSDLYEAGLRVYTTLDIDLQQAAQTVMDEAWSRIERTQGYRHRKYADAISEKAPRKGNETPYLQGMFVAMEPQTGDVRALIGGRDFKDSKFNRATQALRQPGSVFKPFVMTAAVAGGTPVSHIVVDSPFSMPQVDGTIWSPENFDPDYRGPINLRETLKFSVNVPTVKLALEPGMLQSVVRYARRMGIRSPIPEVPAIALGAADVIPMQVAEAYSAFATSGYRPSARVVTRIEDEKGTVLWESKPQVEQVLDSTTAAIVRDLMRDVVDHGTGYNARDPGQGNLPYEIPAAGKTGTTNDFTNIWFAGYTPNLTAVIWFGFDRPRRIIGKASGVLVAPVWGRFMRAAYYGEGAKLPKPGDWEWPSGVRFHSIDRSTGQLATEYCPLNLVYDEVFAAASEPTVTCQTHGPGGIIGTPVPGDTTKQDTVRPPPARDSVRRDTVPHRPGL
jgi:penicillin-binding protein 1A